MTGTDVKYGTQDIIVEEVLPHAPETIWKTLTTSDLIGRWLHMVPTGFAAVKGTRFTMPTKAAGAWDGLIHCEVLDVQPNERLVYSWKSGHAENVGYGAMLDTIVTWTLRKVEDGTRLRLVHSGFSLPKNETAYRGMSEGWVEVVGRVDSITAERDTTHKH
jgi:uncharacterized protein YndB with AHSA1/START domain